jgi:hypothetical protein
LTEPASRFMFHETSFGDVEHVNKFPLAEEVRGLGTCGWPRTKRVAAPWRCRTPE